MRPSTTGVVRWVVLVGYAGLLFLASTRPVPSAYIPGIPHIDKLAHLLAYAILAALCFRAMVPGAAEPPAPVWVLIFAAGLATAYGAAIEFYQDMVSREFEWIDLVANGVGAAAAAAVWEPLTQRYGWLK